MFIDFRERRGERERNTDVGQKHQSVASRTHPDGVKPTTQVCALTEHRTCSIWCTGRCSNQLSHLARAQLQNFISRELVPLHILLRTPPMVYHKQSTLPRKSAKLL